MHGGSNDGDGREAQRSGSYPPPENPLGCLVPTRSTTPKSSVSVIDIEHTPAPVTGSSTNSTSILRRIFSTDRFSGIDFKGDAEMYFLSTYSSAPNSSRPPTPSLHALQGRISMDMSQKPGPLARRRDLFPLGVPVVDFGKNDARFVGYDVLYSPPRLLLRIAVIAPSAVSIPT